MNDDDVVRLDIIIADLFFSVLCCACLGWRRDLTGMGSVGVFAFFFFRAVGSEVRWQVGLKHEIELDRMREGEGGYRYVPNV